MRGTVGDILCETISWGGSWFISETLVHEQMLTRACIPLPHVGPTAKFFCFLNICVLPCPGSNQIVVYQNRRTIAGGGGTLKFFLPWAILGSKKLISAAPRYGPSKV